MVLSSTVKNLALKRQKAYNAKTRFFRTVTINLTGLTVK